jgi:hypothetical protein
MFRTTAGATERGGPPARGQRDGAALRRRFVILILGFLVVYGATIVAFFVTGRYRVPLVPFVAMGAALVLVTLFRLARERRWARAGTLALSALALVGVLRVDFLSVRESSKGFAGFSEALDRLDIGDAGGAIAILEQIRAERSIRAPELYKALIRAYIERDAPGDRALILTTAEEGIDAHPEEAELLWYASVGSFEAGRLDAALDRVNRYLARRPEDVKALTLAVGIALARDDEALARAFLARAERVDPRHPLVVGMRDRMDAAR